jgi:hypothetical protein
MNSNSKAKTTRRALVAAVACSVAGVLTSSASITVDAWYRLGEDGVGASNLPKDSSTNGYDFVNTDSNPAGVTTSTTAPAPGSTEFYNFSGDMTGFDTVSSTTVSNWLPPTDNVGVECWAQSHDLAYDNLTTVGRVVFGTGDNTHGLGILYDDFGAGFVGVIGNINYVGLPYQPKTTNEWVHLAVVRNNGVSTFYVNGVAVSPTRTDNPNASTGVYMGHGGSLSNFCGAIDEARIFTFKPGEFYPNDLEFYQATNTMPYVTIVKSDPTGFQVGLQDKTTTVNTNTIAVQLDGNSVTGAVTQASGLTTINYTAPALLGSGSTHSIKLVFADSAGVYQTNNLSFTVVTYTGIPASLLVPAASVDTTKPGFRIRPYQTDGSTDPNGVQPNSLAWTEDQLIGLHGPNIANPVGADANGFVAVTGVINFSIEAGTGTDRGDFMNDQPFPGIPGILGTTGDASFEAVTFLQFPAAGVYKMGVNSDDGFKVTVGANPRDRFSTVLGQFDGGRGASDTIFTIAVPQAGFYPFRLLWENGNGELPGNQASVEWFTVQADGTKVLINDSTSPIKAYRQGPLPPFVSRVVPAINALGVMPAATLEVDITDDGTQVKSGSVQIGLNGGALGVPTTLNKSGSVTVATFAPTNAFVIGSVNTAQIAYADTGSYAVTNTWQFTILNATLPANLWSAPGSGDKTKPGFRTHTWQINQFMANNGANSDITDELPVANQILLGLWGANIANTSLAVNGEFITTNVVNWNYQADSGVDAGVFTSADGHTDSEIPGIPGTDVNGNPFYNDYSTETYTYIEFPSAGVYTMGVNSDDGFRVTCATNTGPDIGALRVTAPASVAGNYPTVATYPSMGGAFGGPLPTTPIVRPLVLSDDGSTTNNLDTANAGDSYTFMTQPAVNAADLKGNIAVVRRGVVAFAQKAKYAQDAGALAVVIVDRSDLAGQMPWSMGGSDPSVTIPCVMVEWDVWAKIRQYVTTNAATTQVTVSLGDDNSPMLGQYDGGRGASTDITNPGTLFSFYVPKAGLYPMRLLYFQGGGAASCEWFSLDSKGNPVLINDAANAASLKAYRARTETAVPTISIATSGANAVITFTGTLQSADDVAGTWSNVTGATSPMTVPLTQATKKFYRASQ